VLYPAIVGLAVAINLFFVFYKGTENLGFTEELSIGYVLLIAIGTGLVIGSFIYFFVCPRLRTRINNKIENAENVQLEAQAEAVVNGQNNNNSDVPSENEVAPAAALPDSDSEQEQTNLKSGLMSKVSSSFKNAFNKAADATYRQDLQALSLQENAKAAEIWKNSEVFDKHSEELFSYLQVFTAMLDSFAHGANDNANSIAPLSAILALYADGAVSSKSPVQKWVLALGGLGIVLGLALYGYKIIKALGYKLTSLTPSRGFTVELSTSLVVVVASFAGIPVSSTQCQVGATAGVGAAEGRGQVHWAFLAKVVLGWVGTFFAVVITSAGLFAFSAYSPSLAA
jgi:sodium-dependent phosphate transporter